MSDTAIKVEGLGKQYLIGAVEKRNETFREMLMSSLSEPIRGLRSMNGHVAAADRFWALKDVSFEVKRGEVLGVIGPNGAGKSTLLKILSRITEPTEGRATIQGRVASLLEVGTGFHPELTGRENIYLNGAILGMSRAEIDHKFDEIVEFAGVEKFLDTPTKRYSSGMFVRLAFAVAAHLEPEILVVDEVLAVGDAEFQRSCLGKMKSVSKQGRTVLLVSHNMGAIGTLCDRVLLMEQGQPIAFDGVPSKGVSEYLSRLSPPGAKTQMTRSHPRDAKGPVFLESVRMTAEGREAEDFLAGSDVTIEFEYRNLGNLSSARFLFTIFNESGLAIFHTSNDLVGQRIRLTEECGVVRCLLPRIALNRGKYRIAVAIQDECGSPQFDHVSSAKMFSIVGSKYYSTGKMPDPAYSPVMLENSWITL